MKLPRQLRIVGDVHGDIKGFSAALDTDRFVVQLGDLVDGSPDTATTNNAATLAAALDMWDANRGLFLLGNHDWKLARALAGRDVRVDRALELTLSQLDAPLRARALAAIPFAPVWLRAPGILFVHGGFHTLMLQQDPPSPMTNLTPVVSRALYGEPTGRTQPDGYPERSIRWVDRIPAGLTVYCGHDRRSSDGRPLRFTGRAGGEVVFLDTGAGKGGHLSWIDLDQ
jgi:protein phosphatase